MKKENTFGDFEFESWVPESTREMIRDFWGQVGRTHDDWLRDSCGVRECCYYISCQGFGEPPYGASVYYFVKEGELFKKIKGRYIHRWNNMGSLIEEDGNDYTVSSCDWWVRIFDTKDDVQTALS